MIDCVKPKRKSYFAKFQVTDNFTTKKIVDFRDERGNPICVVFQLTNPDYANVFVELAINYLATDDGWTYSGKNPDYVLTVAIKLKSNNALYFKTDYEIYKDTIIDLTTILASRKFLLSLNLANKTEQYGMESCGTYDFAHLQNGFNAFSNLVGKNGKIVWLSNYTCTVDSNTFTSKISNIYKSLKTIPLTDRVYLTLDKDSRDSDGFVKLYFNAPIYLARFNDYMTFKNTASENLCPQEA